MCTGRSKQRGDGQGRDRVWAGTARAQRENAQWEPKAKLRWAREGREKNKTHRSSLVLPKASGGS